jgi:hypothetical protein
MQTTDTQYFVGQGYAMFAQRAANAGIISGFSRFGDASGLEISTKADNVTVQENITGQGGVAGYAQVGFQASVKATLQNISLQNLGLAFFGGVTENVATGTVAAEAFTAYAGTSYPLANIGVQSGTLVIKLAGGAGTALVEGTDYSVDYKQGIVTFLPGSALVTGTAGVALTAAYSYAAYTGKMAGLTLQQPEISVLFGGLNQMASDGSGGLKAVRVQLHRVKLDLAKVWQLISRKETTLELDGMLLYDGNNPSSPYFDVIQA